TQWVRMGHLSMPPNLFSLARSDEARLAVNVGEKKIDIFDLATGFRLSLTMRDSEVFRSLNAGSRYPGFFIRILICASTPNIRRRSRMQECGTCDLCGGRWVTGVPTATWINISKRHRYVPVIPAQALG